MLTIGGALTMLDCIYILYYVIWVEFMWQIIIQFAQDTDGSHDNAQYLTFCETL